MSWLDDPLEPNPVVEALKKDVDRSLLRANLDRTIDERLEHMASMQRLIEDLRAAKARQQSS